MAKWVTVAARFTLDEYAQLEEFKNRHKIESDNQMLRDAVMVFAQLRDMLEAASSNPDFGPLMRFREELEKELESEEYKATLERVGERMKKEFTEEQVKKIEEAFGQINERYKPFQVERKRGRPALTQTRRRGRPTDTGKD